MVFKQEFVIEKKRIPREAFAEGKFLYLIAVKLENCDCSWVEKDFKLSLNPDVVFLLTDIFFLSGVRKLSP